MKRVYFAILLVLSLPLLSAEYLHNGRFLGLDYRSDLHRHRFQPHWEMTPHSYSAYRLMKDVEADVAKSHLNIKCVKPPKVGYSRLNLDAAFIAIPHAPVRISFRARGSGKISAFVYEYVLGENGRREWLGRGATMKPVVAKTEWGTYSFDYQPRQGELGAVLLRFNFSPASGDALDLDFGEVSASGEEAPRRAVPATFVIPRLAAPPKLDAPCDWPGALVLTGFKENDNDLPQAGTTTVQAGYDNGTLYLGFRSDSGEPPAAKFTARDSTVFRDDSVEAVLADVDDRGFAHFIINPLNAVYDRNGRDSRASRWNADLRSAAGHSSTGYWANLALPRDGLPVPLKEGAPFKVNFLETDITRRGGGRRILYLSWSHACEPGTHVNAANTLLFPVAVLSPELISAGVRVTPKGALELALQNPAADSHVFCEYGTAARHLGTVKVAAPHGEKRFTLPFVPDNELAVLVVRDAKGRELYRNAEIFRHRLESHLGFRSYLPLGYVELTSDITALPEYRLRWQLDNGKSGVFQVKGEARDLRVDITSLPVGKPSRLTVQIENTAGASLGTRAFAITRPPREPWTGSTLGITDQPLPPFTAIRQADDGLDFLQTAMRFRGRALPAAMTAQGHDLLAGPARLLLDGADLADATPRTVTAARPNRVEWTAENDKCRWSGWAEEDGFSWHTVTLKASGATVQDLHLDLPVRREYARLLSPYPVFRSGGDMDGRWAYDGKPWASLDFKQYFTLRSEERGIELTAEDERDCVRRSPAGSHRLFMQDGHAVIRLTFIDRPVKLDRERTYRFGLQAFPAKPLVRAKDYLQMCSYIDPRTAAWSGGRQKALVQVSGFDAPAAEGTVEWSAFWAFDPQAVHPDYHLRPLLAQTLVSFGNLGLNFEPGLGFTLRQAGKSLPSAIPAPPLARGWHRAALAWKGNAATLFLDGREAARFTLAKPPARFNAVTFGRSNDQRHADFHYEALKVSSTALAPAEQGRFEKTQGTLLLHRFAPDQRPLFTGEVRAVATDRGTLPSTAAEFFTRLDALEAAGFKAHLAYLNRIFQFYGTPPHGYRNQPYTNDEGYKAFGILLDDLKRRGMRIFFGYSFGVRVGSREDLLYRDYYRVEPAAFYGATESGFWYLCAGCRDYNDFLLHSFDDLMRRYDNLGIYTDNLFVCGRLCKNKAHGCGYRDLDDGGALKPSGNLLKGRAFAKRLYAITKLRPVPREHFMHSSACNHAVFLSWCDKYLCGEQYLENSDKKGWDIDLAQFRAQNDTTRAFGVPAYAISTFVPFRHHGMLAVAGLHDVATYGAHHHRYAEDVFDYAPFLRATSRFGTHDADFHPYYGNDGLARTDQTRKQFASLWIKPGRALVLVSNLNWQAADVTLRLDLKRLGLKGNARDAITDAPVPLAPDGTATLPIPAYDWRLLRVE